MHWGEEVEYSIYLFDDESKRVKLGSNALEWIEEFNSIHLEKELHLQPEFGNWMIESIPSFPYQSIYEADEILSCYKKMQKRRDIL